ncbi:MAG TPA: MFS transporter [Acidimicrobiales bacterium]|nr:MFS transporter [Acidimicrobiales bacterium]
MIDNARNRGGVAGGTTRTPTDSRAARRMVLAILCLAQFMLIVDVVVVNVALPSIRSDLDIADSRLQLVAVGYTLTFGSLLILFGRMGDLFGRRRLFLAGLAVFTLASLATGLAASEWLLFASRAAQGVGAAMVSPTALALLMASFREGEERNRALGYWGAVGSGGAIAGQLLGGSLTGAFGWRSIFLVNVPIGVLALVAAGRHLEESRPEERPHLDGRGACLLVAGLVAAIVSLTRLGEGQGLSGALWTGAAAVVLLGAFARTERRHPAPLVDTGLLRVGHVLPANLLLAINAGMLSGTLFFTTLYLQVVLGYSPLAVGAAFAPITLVILLLSPRVGALVATVGVRRLLTVGFTLSALGMAVLARLPQDGSYAADVLPALVLVALGSAFAYAPTFVAGTADVPTDKQGLASGLLNTSQELGAAVGLTMLATVAAAATTPAVPTSAVAGYRAGLLLAAAVTALALVAVRRLLTPRTGVATGDPSERARH